MDSIFANRQITVSYAYKKDTKGERRGTPAERVFAASNPTAQKSRPHTLFASGPPTLADAPQANVTKNVAISQSCRKFKKYPQMELRQVRGRKYVGSDYCSEIQASKKLMQTEFTERMLADTCFTLPYNNPKP